MTTPKSDKIRIQIKAGAAFLAAILGLLLVILLVKFLLSQT